MGLFKKMLGKESGAPKPAETAPETKVDQVQSAEQPEKSANELGHERANQALEGAKKLWGSVRERLSQSGTKTKERLGNLMKRGLGMASEAFFTTVGAAEKGATATVKKAEQGIRKTAEMGREAVAFVGETAEEAGELATMGKEALIQKGEEVIDNLNVLAEIGVAVGEVGAEEATKLYEAASKYTNDEIAKAKQGLEAMKNAGVEWATDTAAIGVMGAIEAGIAVHDGAMDAKAFMEQKAVDTWNRGVEIKDAAIKKGEEAIDALNVLGEIGVAVGEVGAEEATKLYEAASKYTNDEIAKAKQGLEAMKNAGVEWATDTAVSAVAGAIEAGIAVHDGAMDAKAFVEQKAVDTWNRGVDIKNTAVEKATDLANQGREAYNNMRDRVSAAKDSFSSWFNNKRKEMLGTAQLEGEVSELKELVARQNALIEQLTQLQGIQPEAPSVENKQSA